MGDKVTLSQRRLRQWHLLKMVLEGRMSLNSGDIIFIWFFDWVLARVFASESYLRFQDEVLHNKGSGKLSICGRNIHRMRTDGKSIVQLGIFQSHIESTFPAQYGGAQNPLTTEELPVPIPSKPLNFTHGP
jgi:hypothetical protein